MSRLAECCTDLQGLAATTLDIWAIAFEHQQLDTMQELVVAFTVLQPQLLQALTIEALDLESSPQSIGV